MTDKQTVNPNPERDERGSNLTGHDKTRFLERGFTVAENTGHSLRLIKRDDARQAISIKWDDLPALRELITLALDDGPMLVEPNTSSQPSKNVAAEDERVKKIERWLMLHTPYRSDPYADRAQAFSDLRFLLSLLNRQTIELAQAHANVESLSQIIFRSEHATRMRDRCVARVRVLAQSWEQAAMQWHEKAQAESRPDFKRINYEERDACLQKRDAANVIANNLQSLTLDRVEQEK